MRGAATAVGLASAGVGLTWWAAFGARTQLWGDFPYRADTTALRVALTFDDGPNEPHTSALLDVLAARDVAATFFQVGRCALRHPEVTRRVVTEGHVLGNHSLSHAFHRYLTEPAQGREIDLAQEILADIAGVSPGLYRPPWLGHPPWVLRAIRDRGLQVVSGTFGHPLEVFQPPGPAMAAYADARVQPGSILIFHDGREARGGPRGRTVAAIGPLIDRLRSRGYVFVTVDELLGVPAYLDASGVTAKTP